jgi:molybdopterin molybdotransferase
MTGSPLESVESHLAGILASVGATAHERVDLERAAGRTLVAPVLAAVDIPAFENSAMDGFAVRFAEVSGADASTPTRLRVVADLPAGSALDPRLLAGDAARIMTGAPVPTDADTIVPVEDTSGRLDDALESVLVTAAPTRLGAHVRRRGDDIVAGGLVLAAGTLIGHVQLGAIAAAGIGAVEVAAAPRIAIVSTGSELAAPGAPLAPGMIPESNSWLLAAAAREAGADVVLRRSIPDDPAMLLAIVAEATALALDTIVFTGGVSAGAYEVVKQAMTGMRFSRLAMQPGKPQGFGVGEHGMLMFGLPGNPVSAAVSFEVFVRPALLLMQGRASIQRPLITLAAGAGWRTPSGRRQYLPVRIDRTDPSAWHVLPATSGGSHLAGGLGRAEGFAVVPAEVDRVDAGDPVDVMLLP